MYNIQYQYTHDIDWFFLIGNKPIHCASNGGRIPNIYRAVDLQNLQVKVESIKPSCRFILNKASLESYVYEHYRNTDNNNILSQERQNFVDGIEYDNDTPTWMKTYSWSFVKMAQRGFYSFDHDAKTGHYFLVASPAEEVEAIRSIGELMFNLPEQECLFFDEHSVRNNFSKQINFVSTIERYIRKYGN